MSSSQRIARVLFFSLILLLAPSVQSGAGTIMITGNDTIPGTAASLASLNLSDGRLILGDIVKAFSLRTSMDLLGERLDLVGDGGSCRLLLDSPLVLSRGLFAVLTSPLGTAGGALSVPLDFLTKVLPALIGRAVSLDGEDSMTVGSPGTGSFDGIPMEDLPRYASFIERDKYKQPVDTNKVNHGLRVVVLDPGHGGRSSGAHGNAGTVEKALVLSVTEKLKTMLEDDLGIKVVLTRTADYFVGLKERTAIANNNRADLFVSVHANAAFREGVNGCETYYLSFSASDLEASQLAQVENKALGINGDLRQGPILEAILWDMAQLEFLNESGQVASRVQKSMVKTLNVRDRGVRQAPLAVLVGARMPAILVEVGFITNPAEEINLDRDSYQTRIARALFDAIADYNRALLRGEVRTDNL